MTEWVPLTDALKAVALDGDSLVDAFKTLVLRHYSGVMRCMAGTQRIPNGSARRDVILDGAVWNDAPFWSEADTAIAANVFPIHRGIVVADIAFDREGVETVAQRPITDSDPADQQPGPPTGDKPSHAAVKDALREYMTVAGFGQDQAIKALKVHFKGQELPSREHYLRPWAAEIALSIGRDPSKRGPRQDD